MLCLMKFWSEFGFHLSMNRAPSNLQTMTSAVVLSQQTNLSFCKPYHQILTLSQKQLQSHFIFTNPNQGLESVSATCLRFQRTSSAISHQHRAQNLLRVFLIACETKLDSLDLTRNIDALAFGSTMLHTVGHLWVIFFPLGRETYSIYKGFKDEIYQACSRFPPLQKVFSLSEKSRRELEWITLRVLDKALLLSLNSKFRATTSRICCAFSDLMTLCIRILSDLESESTTYERGKESLDFLNDRLRLWNAVSVSDQDPNHSSKTELIQLEQSSVDLEIPQNSASFTQKDLNSLENYKKAKQSHLRTSLWLKTSTLLSPQMEFPNFSSHSRYERVCEYLESVLLDSHIGNSANIRDQIISATLNLFELSQYHQQTEEVLLFLGRSKLSSQQTGAFMALQSLTNYYVDKNLDRITEKLHKCFSMKEEGNNWFVAGQILLHFGDTDFVIAKIFEFIRPHYSLKKESLNALASLVITGSSQKEYLISISSLTFH